LGYLPKIKSIYGDIKGLLSQIPPTDKDGLTSNIVVNGFNNTLTELSQATNTDYSKYEIPSEARNRNFRERFDSKIARAQIGRVIGRLEEKYGFGKSDAANSPPGIFIFNKNQNEISLQINYTLNELIDETGSDDAKMQLRELRDELEKPTKSWDKIRPILIWILNFSKDLFLKILPILLQKQGF
jgi:hypothetical protein